MLDPEVLDSTCCIYSDTLSPVWMTLGHGSESSDWTVLRYCSCLFYPQQPQAAIWSSFFKYIHYYTGLRCGTQDLLVEACALLVMARDLALPRMEPGAPALGAWCLSH